MTLDPATIGAVLNAVRDYLNGIDMPEIGTQVHHELSRALATRPPEPTPPGGLRPAREVAEDIIRQVAEWVVVDREDLRQRLIGHALYHIELDRLARGDAVTARERLRDIADDCGNACDWSNAAALRELADRIDAERLLLEEAYTTRGKDIDGVRWEVLFEILARLDAPLEGKPK